MNWCQVERLVPALAEPQPARKLNMIIPAKKSACIEWNFGAIVGQKQQQM